MDVCRRENCDQPPVLNGLGFCFDDLTAYLEARQKFTDLAAELRHTMPAVFALLDDNEAARLAEFIVGRAATGTRGFSNDFLLAGELTASYDALDEAREEAAHKRGASGGRARGARRRVRLAGGLA